MTHKVLVVDDFEPIRNMYIDILKRCHIDVIDAKNGEEALRLINSEQPHVIVLDVDMPRMSGLEVLQHVRRNPITKDIPVILVTANHTIEHSDITSDADLFLIKPVSPLDLISFVRRFLPSLNGV